MPKNTAALEVLETAKEPIKLARAAQQLAASADPEDHAALLKYLQSETFRQKLDPPEEETTGPDDLLLARPIRTLTANKAPPARETLLALIRDEEFLKHPDRVDILVRATGAMRPPPPVVLAFWKRFTVPDDIHTEFIIRTEVENGSAPAIACFEDALQDSRFDEELRVAWMRRHVLEFRAETEILAMADRLVTGPTSKLSKPLKLALAEALCDYRPEEWYGPHRIAKPQSRARTRRPGRDALRKLATFVKEQLSPDPKLRAALEKTVAELDALDKAHAP
jgi:hypothetical protein